MAAAFASPENVPVSSLVVTPAFDGLLRPRSFDLSLNPFQMTPAQTLENTVPCNAQRDTRGTTLAVRCASAASQCLSVGL